MYHAIFVEDLLDLVASPKAFRRAARPTVERWRETVAAMLGWLAVMTHPTATSPSSTTRRSASSPGGHSHAPRRKLRIEPGPR